MISTNPPATSLRCRGMSDLSPAEMAKFQRVTQAFRDVSAAYGYGEIRTPTIEYLHLFTSAGTLTPGMLSRVYSFLDWDGWSGQRVVLRPDATIPAVRFYTERYRPGEIAKLSYVENVFRFADGDESREDWQCGLEIIGDTAPVGDIELIQLALTVLRRIGVPDLEVRISNAGLVRAILAKTGLPPEQQSQLNDRILDGDPRVLDELERIIPAGETPLRVLLEMEANTSAFLANLAELVSRSLPETRAPLLELAPIVETLELLGCKLRISAMLVRNFEYYTGPVFQVWSGDRLLGAGGRYDDLVGLASGNRVPASGIALHLDAIASAMPDGLPSTNRIAVILEQEPASPALLAAAFEAAASCTALGWQAIINKSPVRAEDADRVLYVDESGGQTKFRLHNTADGSWKLFTSIADLSALLGTAQP